MDRRIDIEMIQAGQPRPYSDSYYEATIRFSFIDNDALQYNPDRDIVEQVARLFVRDWAEPSDEGTIGWWQARLNFLHQKEKGVWHVKVTQPYCD